MITRAQLTKRWNAVSDENAQLREQVKWLRSDNAAMMHMSQWDDEREQKLKDEVRELKKEIRGLLQPQEVVTVNIF